MQQELEADDGESLEHCQSHLLLNPLSRALQQQPWLFWSIRATFQEGVGENNEGGELMWNPDWSGERKAAAEAFRPGLPAQAVLD